MRKKEELHRIILCWMIRLLEVRLLVLMLQLLGRRRSWFEWSKLMSSDSTLFLRQRLSTISWWSRLAKELLEKLVLGFINWLENTLPSKVLIRITWKIVSQGRKFSKKFTFWRKFIIKISWDCLKCLKARIISSSLQNTHQQETYSIMSNERRDLMRKRRSSYLKRFSMD